MKDKKTKNGEFIIEAAPDEKKRSRKYNNKITDLIDKLHYSRAIKKRNLVFYPIFMDASPGQEDYLLLDEALAIGVLEVSEADDEGRVNVIGINNTAEKSVLIFDGDELIGAYQNRIVNTTILVPAQSRHEIPVSCVEEGRWGSESSNFSSSEVFGYCELRKQKARQVAANLARGLSFNADQAEIWSEIERKHTKTNVHSDTNALHDVYQDKRYIIEDYLDGLEPVYGQVGVAVFSGGSFLCMDIFDSHRTLKKIWKKLIRGYAMEVLECPEKEGDGEIPGLDSILEAICNTRPKKYKSIGQGDDFRLSSKKIVGAGLFDGNNLVHLSVFSKEVKRNNF